MSYVREYLDNVRGCKDLRIRVTRYTNYRNTVRGFFIGDLTYAIERYTVDNRNRTPLFVLNHR